MESVTHLGNSTPITTINNEELLLTSVDGKPFKIKVADLAEAVRQVMPVATGGKNGLMGKDGFFYRGVIGAGSDFNSIIDTGFYHYYIEIGSVVNGPELPRMVLLCIQASSHIIQIAFSVEVNQNRILYRGSWNQGGTWNEWRSVSFT